MSSDDPNIDLTDFRGAPGVIDAALLDRYVSGQASLADEETVRALGGDHPVMEELLAAMRAVPAGGIPVHQRANVMLGWKRFLERQQWAKRGVRRFSPAVQLREGFKAGLLPRGLFKPQPLPYWVLKKHSVRRSVRYAGMAGASLVVAVASWYLGVRSSKHPTVTMTAYTTGNGERATITLPDGGTVVLNVASQLRVPSNYMLGNRRVELSGEGLFTVPHQDGTPLSVTAGGTTVRVLGTSFVVRRYSTDTAAMVAVQTGKVAVGGTVVTSAEVVYAPRRGAQLLYRADPSLFSFATGTLTITRALLPEAIQELDRWYDADIRLGDTALATQRMTGVFRTGSLGDLAESLEFTYNVRVVRVGRVITLYPKP